MEVLIYASIYGNGFVSPLNATPAGGNPSNSVGFTFKRNSWKPYTLEIETTVANWLPLACGVVFKFCGTFASEEDTYRLIIPEMIKTEERLLVGLSSPDKVNIVFQGAYRGRDTSRQVIFLKLPDPKTIACDGCINYHGKTYGGSKLVCAIHPAGVDGDRCGDWEGKLETKL